MNEMKLKLHVNLTHRGMHLSSVEAQFDNFL